MLLPYREANAELRRLKFRLVDGAGDPVPAQTFSGSEIQLGLNGAALSNFDGEYTEIGGGDYYYTATVEEFSTLGFLEFVVDKSGCDTVRETHQIVGFPIYSSFLPNQTFYDQVTDERGNAVPYVTVNVYAAGTSNLIATCITDAGGRYSITLTPSLDLLVDLEFMGGGLQTFRKTNVRLS